MKNTFFKEFKKFSIRGNMVDLAVGIIIGTAFNNVINTLVNKVILPPIVLLTNGINFDDKKWVLRHAVYNGDELLKSEVAIEYGTLITVLSNFFVIALCTFFIIKIMNRLRDMANDTKDTEVKTPKDIELLSDLKEAMEEQNELLREFIKKK